MNWQTMRLYFLTVKNGLNSLFDMILITRVTKTASMLLIAAIIFFVFLADFLWKTTSPSFLRFFFLYLKSQFFCNIFEIYTTTSIEINHYCHSWFNFEGGENFIISLENLCRRTELIYNYIQGTNPVVCYNFLSCYAFNLEIQLRHP